jgi:hypothetical protein
MSEQLFYVEFVFTPKRGSGIDRHRVAVEIPKSLVGEQLEASADGRSEERLFVLKLAGSAARAAFWSALEAEEVEFPYHEDAIWHEERLPTMKERSPDLSENRMNVWLIH